MEENRYIEEQYDEIDIMELIKKLLAEWKLILKYCVIAGIVGIIVGFSIPKEYTVSAKLAPESGSKSSGGSLSSLAAMAGINLGSMSSTDAVSPDLYPDIVTSVPFIVDLFSVPVEFEHKKEVVNTDVYEYLKEYTRAPWWNHVISAPMKGLSWFMGLFREKVEPVEGYADIDPSALTYEQAEMVKAIRESVTLSVDKKTGTITTTVVAQNPKVAYVLCQEIIDRLQKYITDYRTEKSRKDLAYYEELYAEAEADYFDAQQRYAKYEDSHQGILRESVRIEGQRLQNEMNLKYNLYNSCAQQVQMAKAQVQQETPVYAVINPPTQPLKQTKPSKLKTLVVFVFLGAVVACVWVLWGRDIIAKFRNEEEDADAPVAKEVS